MERCLSGCHPKDGPPGAEKGHAKLVLFVFNIRVKSWRGA